MADILIENLILSIELNQSIQLKQVDADFPEATFNKDQLPAVVFQYHNPRRVVILTAQGKMMCMGSKTKEEATQTLISTINALKKKKIINESIAVNPKLEHIVASKKLPYSLPLNEIKSKLPFDQCTFEPSVHPWLEYRNSTYSMLLFPSGNIICTGKLSLDESKKAFEKIEHALTSIGCNVTDLN